MPSAKARVNLGSCLFMTANKALRTVVSDQITAWHVPHHHVLLKI